MRRTQIYLDEAQHQRLSERAKSAGTTKSDVIREAVDAYLAGPEDERARLRAFRAAVRAVAGSVPRLPPGDRYVEEIRRGDLVRQQDLLDRRDR